MREDGEDAGDDPEDRPADQLGDLLGHLGLRELDLLVHEQLGLLGDVLDCASEVARLLVGHYSAILFRMRANRNAPPNAAAR